MDDHLEHSTKAAGVPPSYVMVLRLYLRESYGELKTVHCHQ